MIKRSFQRLTLLAGILSVLFPLPGIAAIAISVSGGTFLDEAGLEPIPEDALFQLINLGQDAMASSVMEGQWASADDVLIDLIYGVDTEYATSGGFDLSEGLLFSEGLLSRVFDFSVTPGVIEPGDLIMLRWWPGYTANDFHNGVTPVEGDAYGQARVETAVNGSENTAWIVPEETEINANFDPLISPVYAADSPVELVTTTDFDGTAQFVVIPEPATVAQVFALLGFFLWSGLKKRRM